ncbi:hypothetical protein [Hydrogenophilus thiooxidans]|uniref:hypothetical protein n=1 Tax=Hydrogenophilus thiooxidans TaxID=2820326 RepID=UPI001C2188E3|nr:hypothetical protein [Hydrogenophilus thiooxidans]
MSGLLLGQTVAVPEGYAPQLLTPIARAIGRATLGDALPQWVGEDRWYGYECSWLDVNGKPQAAVIEIGVPADSPYLIESKSLKLYLNGFNQIRCGSGDALAARIEADLTAVANAPVRVLLHPLAHFSRAVASDFADPEALCLDTVPATDFCYHYDPTLLALSSSVPSEQRFVMQTFRSLCPVTAQPDWASLYLRCFGPSVDPAALLRYLVAFRCHAEFHEQCIERIYTDLWRLGMSELLVWGRFLRRGGLEINPLRASSEAWLPRHWVADSRQ